MRTAATLIGFLALSMSPSFIDWEQSPEKRSQFIIYYAVTLGLLYFGLLA